MRKEMLAVMFDEFVDSRLCQKSEKQFKEILTYVRKATNSAFCEDEVVSMIASFQYEVFMSACNMILDFVSGKDKDNNAPNS